MNRFLVLTVLVMSGLLTACEKSDTETTMDKAADVASDAADASKKATGEVIEYTGDKMQQAGEAMSETGESMQTPE
jgi:major membrane immunogen (membrane-anchored lipoprotein)